MGSLVWYVSQYISQELVNTLTDSQHLIEIQSKYWLIILVGWRWTIGKVWTNYRLTLNSVNSWSPSGWVSEDYWLNVNWLSADSRQICRSTISQHYVLTDCQSIYQLTYQMRLPIETPSQLNTMHLVYSDKYICIGNLKWGCICFPALIQIQVKSFF